MTERPHHPPPLPSPDLQHEPIKSAAGSSLNVEFIGFSRDMGTAGDQAGQLHNCRQSHKYRGGGIHGSSSGTTKECIECNVLRDNDLRGRMNVRNDMEDYVGRVPFMLFWSEWPGGYFVGHMWGLFVILICKPSELIYKSSNWQLFWIIIRLE